MPNATSDSVENMANIRQGLYHGDLIIHWEIKGYQKVVNKKYITRHMQTKEGREAGGVWSRSSE